MSKQDMVTIRKIPTGVNGLDEVLGGGLPEFSFNIIGGAPGCGKTTLAHQIVFANATPERPALYFTVLGEPALKMLRYQQQYQFFDSAKLKNAIRFVNLSKVALEEDLEHVLDQIISEVNASNPGIVVVDSFRTMKWKQQSGNGSSELQAFVQRLALHLTTWQATTFLIGEYSNREIQNHPIFTVADGLLWLSQSVERNSVVRKLQVMKLRGQASVPGMHTIRISTEGVQAFPRTFGLTSNKSRGISDYRLSTGIPELDKLMGGGVNQGDSLLITGPGGSGKSHFCTHFIAAGVKKGEPGIIAVFEEQPEAYYRRAKRMGLDLESAKKKGLVDVLYLRPLDLSVDETVHEIASTVRRIGAMRLVIDSLAGFEMALAPGFRADFRESLYRMIGALTRLGVTIVSAVETQETLHNFGSSPYDISFLSDEIVRLRYVYSKGQLRKTLAVVKMRSSAHSDELHEYKVTEKGISIGEPYLGMNTDSPTP